MDDASPATAATPRANQRFEPPHFWAGRCCCAKPPTPPFSIFPCTCSSTPNPSVAAAYSLES
jgi:hypothetical protein